jgi:nucleotide-binding universal stress UspA family protein
MAREQKSHLVVVHIDQLLVGRGGAQHMQVLEPELQAHVQGQVADLRAAGIEAELELRTICRGSTAGAITRTARDTDADVIVVGGRRRGALLGLLHGSVAHRLLKIAPCPVLVIRGQDRPAFEHPNILKLPYVNHERLSAS